MDTDESNGNKEGRSGGQIDRIKRRVILASDSASVLKVFLQRWACSSDETVTLVCSQPLVATGSNLQRFSSLWGAAFPSVGMDAVGR
jgi:hypothetical protein